MNVDLAACVTHFDVDSETWKVACDWGATFNQRTAHIRYDPSERLVWINRYRHAKTAIAQGTDPARLGLPGIGVSSAANQSGELETSMGRMPIASR